MPKKRSSSSSSRGARPTVAARNNEAHKRGAPRRRTLSEEEQLKLVTPESPTATMHPPEVRGAKTLLDVPEPAQRTAPAVQAPVKGGVLEALERFDQAASRVLHTLSLGLGDYLAVIPALLFSAYVIPMTLAVGFVLLPYHVFSEYLFSVVSVLAVTTSLKRVFGRVRPGLHTLAPKRFNLRSLEKNNAMPSGDSAQGAAALTLLSLHTGSLAPLAGIPFVCAGRIYFGCHWIADTIVGSALGTFIAHAIHGGLHAACSSGQLHALLFERLCEKHGVHRDAGAMH